MSTPIQAVFFRQIFPPPHDPLALSFFGGAPVAPATFRWPRTTEGGKPFTFLMQIDCAAVPAHARLGLLPDRGVLYFFLDLRWAEPDVFRVLYEEGGSHGWTPIAPPDDLGPAYGDPAPYVWKWPQSSQDCPTLLPKWIVQPVAIALEASEPDGEDEEAEDAPLLWSRAIGVGEALRAAQGEDVLSTPFQMQDFIDEAGAMRRPFAHYPHDWRAIQICSGLLLSRLRQQYRVDGAAALRQLSAAERDALAARISDEALNWFTRAASHPPFAAVPQAESDRFWTWLADKTWIVRFFMIEALTMSIEASLTASPDAAARIPDAIARRLHRRHAMVVRTERGLSVTSSDRMLAPPVDVQGYQWDRAKTHLLLLELSANDGLGHEFAEGVYQFWITPDDLKARRFDKVELTADAY